jgi:molybdopterin converting factor small subunit
MIIKVLFFAQLKDIFGANECALEARQGMTVGGLVQDLFKASGTGSFQKWPMLYSINEDFVDENQELFDNDTLALLPPVAGG